MPRFFVVMLGAFALTLFTSATLLFMVQPMIGKMILPMLGGTPAVWNTCMVFFQALLLAGYAYSHATTSKLGERRQAYFHLLLLPIPFLFLPLSINNNWMLKLLTSGDVEGLLIHTDRNPVYALLLILFFTVGIPFFVVSTSAPLLQKWFSNTLHPQARDPYFLYGASNLGSMLALVGYPVVIEPYLSVDAQALWWTVGYVLLATLIASCAYLLWKTPPADTVPAPAATPELPATASASKEQVTTAPTAKAPASGQNRITKTPAAPRTPGKEAITTEPPAEAEPDPATQPVTAWRRLRWVLLSAIPSSFMLGVTTYLTTDIAAIPLLWIPPLALYLLSFIIVFSRVPRWVHTGFILALPLVLLLLIFMMLSGIAPREVQVAEIWKSIAEMTTRPSMAVRVTGYAIVAGLLAVLGGLVWFGWILTNKADWGKLGVLVGFLVVVLASMALLWEVVIPGLFITIGLHLLALFVVAMVCHGELARDRPQPKYLTEFFLLMSVGGVVGGMFNGLLAPMIFFGNAEYPLVMIFACIMLPPLGGWAGDMSSANGDKAGSGKGKAPAVNRELTWGDTADAVLAVLFLLAAFTLLFLRWRDNDLPLLPHWSESGKMTWELRDVLLESHGIAFVIALSLGLAIGGAYILRNKERWLTATLDVVMPMALGLLVLGLTWGLYANAFYYRDDDGSLIWRIGSLARYLRVSGHSLRMILVYGVPAVLCYTFVERSFRFGLGVGAILLAWGFTGMFDEDILYRERSFFGVLRVEKRYDRYTEWPLTRRLLHGTTLHGVQYYTDLKDTEAKLAKFEEEHPELAGKSREDLRQSIEATLDAEGMPKLPPEILLKDMTALDEKAGNKSLSDLESDLSGLDPEAQKKKLVDLLQELENLKKAEKPDTEAITKLEKVIELRRHVAIKRIKLQLELEDLRDWAERYANLEDTPLSYYHRSGPVGQLFGAYNTIDRHIGVIGLGTGSMSCYGQKGQKMTFFDIDPSVKGISFDTDRFFTFVSRAKKRGVDLQDLVLGDARLTMKKQPLGEFGIIIVDAFSSDAIPIHLITDEAVEMLKDRLREDGILMYHVSNRYLDLRPVLARIAEHQGLASLYNNDSEDEFHNKSGSTWVALARKPEYLSKLLTDQRIKDIKKTIQETLQPLIIQPGLVGSMGQILSGAVGGLRAPWKPLEVDPKVKLWTDTYSDLLSVFMWPRR